MVSVHKFHIAFSSNITFDQIHGLAVTGYFEIDLLLIIMYIALPYIFTIIDIHFIKMHVIFINNLDYERYTYIHLIIFRMNFLTFNRLNLK